MYICTLRDCVYLYLLRRGCEECAKGMQRKSEGVAKGVKRGCVPLTVPSTKRVQGRCEGGAKKVRRGCKGGAKRLCTFICTAHIQGVH